MALRYKTRRRLSLLVLFVGLPVYIGLAWFVLSLFERPSFLVELIVYVILGVLWAIPLKAVFIGVGQADPDAAGQDGQEKSDGDKGQG